MRQDPDVAAEGELGKDLTLLLERIDLIVQRLATAVFLGPRGVEGPPPAAEGPVVGTGARRKPPEDDVGRVEGPAGVVPWL